MVDFELSEFNINFGFKDRNHIELLKKQIQAGYELPIEVYEDNGIYRIIDGGHAYSAYVELGREPKNVRVLTFEDDAEKIAYSRHKNMNRLQQTPVTYTRSIFEELKLRLGVKTDQEVKRFSGDITISKLNLIDTKPVKKTISITLYLRKRLSLSP